MSLANGHPYLAIPGPSVIPDRVQRAMHRGSPNIYEGGLLELVDSLWPDLRMVAGTTGHVAAYIANGHGGWEAANANLFSRGDKALVLACGQFGHSWAISARQMGVEVEVLDFGKAAPADPGQVEAALRADREGRIKAGVRQSMHSVSEHSVVYALLATEVDKNVVQIQQFLSDVSATQGKDGLDDGFEKVKENFDALNASLTRFEKHFVEMGDAEAVKRIQEIKANAAGYYAAGQTMATAYVTGGANAGNKLMPGFDGASEKLQAALVPFVQSQVEQMRGDLGAAEEKTSQIGQTALLIVVVASVLASLVAVVVTGSITRPLARALATAKDVASGQLDRTIEADGSKIGQLLAPLAKMQSTLQQFESAQIEMVRQHELGMIDYQMPVNTLEGAYRSMGQSINAEYLQFFHSPVFYFFLRVFVQF